jgi:hypothetical protein
MENIAPSLLKVVAQAFKGVRAVRGVHVHEERFSDDGLERLGTFEIMSRFKSHFPVVEGFHRSELRRVRRLWDERFAANQIALATLMDTYYGGIAKQVFKMDGSLRPFL